MYKLVCPLYITLPRKTKKDRKIYVNLNTYRNLHYLVNNQVKKLYKEHMAEQINALPMFDKVNIYCKLYRGDKRDGDKDNVICITKKYLYDAIVGFGKLEDDNDKYIKDEHTQPTEYDKGNGRVEVYIEPV